MKSLLLCFIAVVAVPALAIPYHCQIRRQVFSDNGGQTEIESSNIGAFVWDPELSNSAVLILENTPNRFYAALCAVSKSTCTGPMTHMICGLPDGEKPKLLSTDEYVSQLADQLLSEGRPMMRPFTQARTELRSGYLSVNHLRSPMLADTLFCETHEE